MTDHSTGGPRGFIVAAPLIAICRVGKAALIGTTNFGSAGILTGGNLLTITLVATLGGIVFSAARSFVGMRRHNQEFEGENQSERQTS